jgi:dihydrofolate reductase
MPALNYSVIVATDFNLGIGVDDTIPWKCKYDMKFFKEITMNNDIVMGRKTWDSIKSPSLEGRNVFVLTRNKCCLDYKNNVFFVSNVEYIDYIRVKRRWLHRKLFVAGGSTIYNYFFQNHLDGMREVYHNVIESEFSCDTFLNEDMVVYFNKNFKENNTSKFRCSSGSYNLTLNYYQF